MCVVVGGGQQTGWSRRLPSQGRAGHGRARAARIVEAGGGGGSRHSVRAGLRRHLAVVCRFPARRTWSATCAWSSTDTTYPQGPYFAPRTDGAATCSCRTMPARRRAEISQVLRRGRGRLSRWEERLAASGGCSARCCTRSRRGSGRVARRTWLRQARLLASLRDRRARRGGRDAAAHQQHRRPVGGILRIDADARPASVSRVIGTGPARARRRAYVMPHHHIGDTATGRSALGLPARAGWARVGALARRRPVLGAQIRTGATGVGSRSAGGRVTGVTLGERGGDRRGGGTTAHPQISFLRLSTGAELPADFVEDIQRWRARRRRESIWPGPAPGFTGHAGVDPEVIRRRDRAGRASTRSRLLPGGGHREPASLPFADISIPSVFDDSLAPTGHLIVYVHPVGSARLGRSRRTTAELEAYADRMVARVDEVAPGFADSVLHRQVIGPHEMEHEYGLVGGNIFHGEILGGTVVPRPARQPATRTSGPPSGGSTRRVRHTGGGGGTGVPGRKSSVRS